jgi:hypothetical protein
MRMNTRFQTRLNASYTNNFVVIQNDNSAIRGVWQITLWYTPLLSQPPYFSDPLTIVKINHINATYIFCHYCTYLRNNDAI